MKLKICFFLLGLLAYNSKSQAQLRIDSTLLDTTVLARNLNTPWDMVYTLEDTSLWFTERIGKVSRIDLNTNQVNQVLDLQDTAEQFGEGGLLGMAILESVAVVKVYLVYNYRSSNNDYFERLVKFDYDPNQDSLINETVLLDSIPAAVIHNGSRLEIAGNYLYMTTGDAANTNLPQDLSSFAGKVLRIDFNGGIPVDNPIPNSPIYSWGHRNAQGLFFANNFLYSSEHGPSTDDEINIIEKGRNYGWPDVKGFCNTASEIAFCNDSNVVEPIFAWTPTVATSGICFYNHPSIPEWQGNLLLTTLKDQRIINLKLNTTKDSIVETKEYFENRWGRLRDITSDPSGNIYIATNSNPHRIIKLNNINFTSINETSRKSIDLIIYPNPAKDILKVDFGLDHLDVFSLNIYDELGKLHMQSEVMQGKTDIDISGLSGGLYMLEAIDQRGNKVVRKFIVGQ